MSTYDILFKLKKQVVYLSKGKSLDDGETLISPIELLKLRKVMQKLTSKKLPQIDFIEECADIESISGYFFGNNDVEYDLDSYFRRTIDPWLNKLLEDNYEVQVRQITLSVEYGDFHAGILGDIDELENAYKVGNYSHINSLSSKILSTIFKEICNQHNIDYEKTEHHMQLYNRVKPILQLEAKKYSDIGKPLLRDFSSHLEEIIKRLNNLRNLYSDSHGTDQETFISVQSLQPHHFKLIVDTTKTVANFVLSSYLFQYDSKRDVNF